MRRQARLRYRLRRYRAITTHDQGGHGRFDPVDEQPSGSIAAQAFGLEGLHQASQASIGDVGLGNYLQPLIGHVFARRIPKRGTGNAHP
jgi:hypothetical protein